MSLDRRRAIQLFLAAAGLSLWSFEEAWAERAGSPTTVRPQGQNQNAPGGPTIGSKMRPTLVGLAAARTLSDDSIAQAQTLEILGEIFRKSNEVDTQGKPLQQASDEIRSLVASGHILDPTTFDSALAFLTPPPSDAEVAAGYARMVAGGVFSTLGAIASTPGGGAAEAAEAEVFAPVFLLGILASGMDMALSKVPDLLGKDSLPPFSSEQLSALTSWTVKRAVELTDKSDTAMHLGQTLFAAGYLPIDLSQPADEAAKLLGADFEELTRPYFGEQPTNSPARADEEIHGAIMDGFNQLARDSNPTAEDNLYVKALAGANELKKAQETAKDIVALGVVGDDILTFGGNPALGKKLNGLANFGAKMFLDAMTPGLGPLTIAGDMFSGLNALAAIFGSASDPLLDALKPLYAQLGQMAQELDVIASQQQLLLSDIAKVYQLEQINKNLLQSIESRLDTFAKDSQEIQFSQSRSSFDDSRTQLAGFLRDHSEASIAADPNFRSVYELHISDCYKFACETARYPEQATNTTINDQGGLRNLIDTRLRADRLVGLLPRIGSSLALTLPQPTGARSAGPVCPTTWAEGVNCFLEGRCRVASVVLQSESDRLKEMWLDGQYLRELIIAISAPDSINAARKQFRKSAGLPEDSELESVSSISKSTLVGTIFEAASDYVSQNIHTMVARRTTADSDAYGGNGLSVAFDPDPFQQLLDKHLVKLEDCTQHPGYNPGFVDCNVRIVADGRYKDTLLVPHKVMAKRPYEYAADGVVALQTRSQEILRGAVDKPAVEDGMPAHIGAAIRATTEDETAYEFWGHVLILMGALVNWRSARTHSVDAMLLANVTGPFTLMTTTQGLAAYVKRELSFSGDWAFETARAFGHMIDDAIEPIRLQSAALPQNRSTIIVDDTLRRLGGYMLSRSVPFPT